MWQSTWQALHVSSSGKSFWWRWPVPEIASFPCKCSMIKNVFFCITLNTTSLEGFPQKLGDKKTPIGCSSEDPVQWQGQCCGGYERAMSLLPHLGQVNSTRVFFTWVQSFSDGCFDEKSQSRSKMPFPKIALPMHVVWPAWIMVFLPSHSSKMSSK